MVRNTAFTKPALPWSNSTATASTVVDNAACGSTRVRSSW
ncbi:Uncharacterised protein [Mycobacteroides abscessus subsp. abscessus]|nr:Uncharacterised protein [Mycobacteroides abscessus subsp. abscessus]SKU94373.1 Uncharacterised protein [Mycobacteroides abscessus subsp. abscessus]